MDTFMITHIAQWFVLPFTPQWYSKWSADWRRYIVALLYPLFDLGVISLLASELAWWHASSALLPLGALIWGCICLAIWWTRRMCMIETIRFYEADLLSLSEFEKRVNLKKFPGVAGVDGFFRVKGAESVLRPLLPKQKAKTLLEEIAVNHASYVAPALPFLIEGSVEGDEPGLICLVLKLPIQPYSFYEQLEVIAKDPLRAGVLDAINRRKKVAAFPSSPTP